MTRKLLILVFMLAGIAIAGAQEKITFTNPVAADPGASEFRVSSIYMNVVGSQIRAELAEVDPGTTNYKTAGKTVTCAYDGAPADALIKQLNKANFSTTSFQKQVVQKCQTDGKLPAGTVTGVPQ